MTAPGPVDASERNLSGWDFFLLWSGAAIALSEIWAGGLLLPLGLAAGLAVNLLGHLIGNTPMALAGLMGSRHGVPAIVSTRGALGNRGSYLPAALNVVQLVGWTAVMLWIGGHAAAQLVPVAGPRLWIAVVGLLTTLWAFGGHRVWRPLQRVAVILLLALSVVMTVAILREYGLARLVQAERKPGLTFMLGLDLVIAMPVSWIPLVSDYSRFARSSRGAFWGTWLGYLVAGCWMYTVGLCAALATGSASPDAMVIGVLQARGLLWAALLIVVFSTFTTTFLDIYSHAVSLQSLAPRLSERAGIVIGGVLGTVVAMLFPATQYESFLLLIGSAFCPLFGVVLADYFLLRRGQCRAEELYRRGRYWYKGGVNPVALAAWLCGFVIYRWSIASAWPAGASLPSLLGAAAIYLAFMRITSPHHPPSKNQEQSTTNPFP